MLATASQIFEAQFFIQKYIIEYITVFKIIWFSILPLYEFSLLVYRISPLLKIGMPKCGCQEMKRKVLKFTKKKGMSLEDQVPSTDDHINECSPLIN